MIDTHAHYDHKRFDKNRHSLLSTFAEASIAAVINPAMSFASNAKMREELKPYPWIYYGAGIHPNWVCEGDPDEDENRAQQLRVFARDCRTVAIGETGLDYYRVTEPAQQRRQKDWFCRQIFLAKEQKLPLILHIRDADRDAVSILRTHAVSCTGVVHCFRGDFAAAKAYFDLGFLIGIGGSIAFPEETGFREAVKQIPMESILLETDAPFVRPRGYGGKSNTSMSLPIVVQEIAALKGCSGEDVVKMTTNNAVRLFHIWK